MNCDYCAADGAYARDLRAGVRVCKEHYKLIKRLEEHRIPRPEMPTPEPVFTLNEVSEDNHDYTDALLSKSTP